MSHMFNGCSSLITIIYGDSFVNDSLNLAEQMFMSTPCNKHSWTNGSFDDEGTWVFAD